MGSSITKANAMKTARLLYNELSPSTRALLPDVTEANAAEAFGRAFLTYPQVQNEVTAAINKIAYQIIQRDGAVNPLSRFVKGEVFPGYAIEHDFVDYLQAYDFDWSQDHISDLLTGVQDPSVIPLYYKTNFSKQIPATVKTNLIARSMKDWTGLNSIIDAITGRIEDTAEDETYMATKDLFSIAYNGGFMIPVKVNAFDPNTYTEDGLKRNAAIFRAMFNKFNVQSRKYNYLGVKTRTPSERINLLTTADYIGANDVNVLASSFNMDKADFLGRSIALPDLDGMSHCVGTMFDDDFIQIYWNYRRMETPFYNQAGMQWNYFYNFAGIFAYCLFANAVAFVDQLKTIDSVTITAGQSAPKNQYTQLKYTVATSGEGGFTNRCDWKITGNQSKKTRISPFGRIFIGPDEKAGTISVTATSVQDPSKNSTVDVTVTA